MKCLLDYEREVIERWRSSDFFEDETTLLLKILSQGTTLSGGRQLVRLWDKFHRVLGGEYDSIRMINKILECQYLDRPYNRASYLMPLGQLYPGRLVLSVEALSKRNTRSPTKEQRSSWRKSLRLQQKKAWK